MAGSVRIQTLHGFLLHARPYGEHHFFCTFFTQEKGKVHCYIRGRAPEFARQFELKAKLSDSGYYRASRFRYVDAVLATHPRSTYFTLYLNEVIYRLLSPEIPDGLLYGCYMATLIQFTSEQEPQKLIRYFEMQLLSTLGLSIDFNHDQKGDPIRMDAHYKFIAGVGFVLDDHGRYVGRQVKSAGELDITVKGALSVAREVILNQFELVEGVKIHSRLWPSLPK